MAIAGYELPGFYYYKGGFFDILLILVFLAAFFLIPTAIIVLLIVFAVRTIRNHVKERKPASIFRHIRPSTKTFIQFSYIFFPKERVFVIL